MSEIAALGLFGVAVCGLVGLWLVIRFLRHVYDQGGADELRKAATALRIARWRPGPRLPLPRQRVRPNADPPPKLTSGQE